MGALEALMTEVVVHVHQSTPWWQWVTAVALLVATLALVWVTHRLVEATKLLSPTPRLALVDWYAAPYMFLDIHNVGTGAALDVDLTITFEKQDGNPYETRRWRTTTLPTGGRIRFNPPRVAGDYMDAEQVSEHVARITVTGTAKDQRDRAVAIDLAIDDLPGLWEMQKVSVRQTEPAAPDELLALEVQRIRKHFTGP